MPQCRDCRGAILLARALQVPSGWMVLQHRRCNEPTRPAADYRCYFQCHCRQQLQQDEVNQSAVSEALQRRMENVVLSMQSGSHSQRVQAEFLKEVESNMQRAVKGTR
jgi:hypothetical protein